MRHSGIFVYKRFIYMFTQNPIVDSEVISVRVRKGLRASLLKRNIRINEAVKLYLENLSREEEAAETIDRLSRLIAARVKPSKLGFGARSVREDRDNAE